MAAPEPGGNLFRPNILRAEDLHRTGPKPADLLEGQAVAASASQEAFQRRGRPDLVLDILISGSYVECGV